MVVALVKPVNNCPIGPTGPGSTTVGWVAGGGAGGANSTYGMELMVQVLPTVVVVTEHLVMEIKLQVPLEHMQLVVVEEEHGAPHGNGSNSNIGGNGGSGYCSSPL